MNSVFENLKLLDQSFHPKKNVLKFGRNETFVHALAKFILCHDLMSEGCDYVTEAVFVSGDRADVFDLSNGLAFEVVKSETEASILRKKEEYPVRVIVVNAHDLINDLMQKL